MRGDMASSGCASTGGGGGGGGGVGEVGSEPVFVEVREQNDATCIKTVPWATTNA